MAEATAAGATYGAFGAMAIGHATVRSRQSFFDKRQVPFVFALAALLVLNAVLGSGIAGGEGRVVLYAVVFPFVLAGLAGGMLLPMLGRDGSVRKPHHAAASVAAEPVAAELAGDKPVAGVESLMIQLPDHALDDEEENDGGDLPANGGTQEAAKPSPFAMQPATPVVAAVEDEHFFPLEIDKGDELVPLPEDGGLAEIMADLGFGEDVAAPPGFDAVPQKENEPTDWLIHHMDLLNKLK